MTSFSNPNENEEDEEHDETDRQEGGESLRLLCAERQEAELTVVTAAYEPHEAWIEKDRDEASFSVVIRRLNLPFAHMIDNDGHLSVCLTIHVPTLYPEMESLRVASATLEEETSTSTSSEALIHRKIAYNAIPHLVKTCQEVADNVPQGEEAIWQVFQRAQDWVDTEWPVSIATAPTTSTSDATSASTSHQENSLNDTSTVVLFGRRLIYSHHIIAKRKRADIQKLATMLQLTGYMKIGWPGLIVLEGLEAHCQQFYDTIKQWSWQYLVIRGQEIHDVKTTTSASSVDRRIDEERRFKGFVETDNMSEVAQACREADLEALFQTCMKIYPRREAKDKESTTHAAAYGALVHVDHMNAPKAYRKWLRKTAQDLGLNFLVIQYKKGNLTVVARPLICVGVVADDRVAVGAFLKRWRTTKVDVDSHGKPCLERKMDILVEGDMELGYPSERIDWKQHTFQTNDSKEDLVTVSSSEDLLQWVGWMGGGSWRQAASKIFITT